MPTGNGGTETVTNKSDPWGPAQPYLQDIMGQGQSLYNKGAEYAPFSTTVPFSPQSEQALTGIENRATAGSPLTSAAQTSLLDMINGNHSNPALGIAGQYAQNGIANPNEGYLQGSASGAFLNSNPYIDANVHRAQDSVRDYTNAGFSKAGRTGSGYHQDILQKNIGDVASQMYGQNYANERNLMNSAGTSLLGSGDSAAGRKLSAAQLYGNLGQSDNAMRLAAIGAAPGLAANDYTDLSALQGVGQAREGQATNQLNDLLSRWDFSQNSGWDLLSKYAAAVNGYAGLGGTSTTTQPKKDNTGGFLGGFGTLLSGIGAL